ncbi:hypothetical protein [Brumimicrobium salinarum]|nr:hypothetical protein [Brumimicrobium salinarum]
MNRFIFCLLFVFSYTFSSAQSYHSELGVEIQAASFSAQGGTFGGALKFAFVEEETIAFGPSLRYQYMFSNNTYLGTSGKSFTLGGGGFFHYRFLDWFYLGTELEVLKNPFNYMVPDKKWTLTAFIGGGISRDFGFVRLNAGILYDVVDGLNNPNLSNPSPLSRDYFLKISDPTNPNMGKYVPLIYRITFFFPLNRNR